MALAISACSGIGGNPGKPSTPDNLCSIYAQFGNWQTSALASQQQWHIHQSITMAFIKQESAFNATARPPRKRFLGIIPGRHLSSAYGYPQAIDGTWILYQQLTGKTATVRTNFNDAIGFVGWYNSRSVRLNKISPDDAYNLYLAYHEGNGGFAKKSYLAKPWLLNVAQKVAHQAQLYRNQLHLCSPRKLTTD